MKLVRMTSGDEFDALSGWRKVIAFKPGERKRIKTLHNRKIRKLGKRECYVGRL